MRSYALPKDPQAYAVNVHGDVVIPLDFPAIPPSGLDAFGISQQAQRTAATRQPVALRQQLRRRQQP
jgi:hypothetical protein